MTAPCEGFALLLRERDEARAQVDGSNRRTFEAIAERDRAQRELASLRAERERTDEEWSALLDENRRMRDRLRAAGIDPEVTP